MKKPMTPKGERRNAIISGCCCVLLFFLGLFVIISQVHLIFGLIWMAAALLLAILNFRYAALMARGGEADPAYAVAPKPVPPAGSVPHRVDNAFGPGDTLDAPQPIQAPVSQAVQPPAAPRQQLVSEETGQQPGRAHLDPAAQLAQLERLKEAGLLTQEEYRERKEKLNTGR